MHYFGDDKIVRRASIFSSIVLACFILGAWSVYNTRQSSCDTRDTVATLIHDLLVLSVLPDKNQKLTVAQKARILSYLDKANERLVQIRC